MSHHSKETDDMMRNSFGKAMLEHVEKLKAEAESMELGATGNFPAGKIAAQDEGGIRVSISHYQGNVIINFGSPVAWVGFTARQAREIATSLMKHAKLVEKK